MRKIFTTKKRIVIAAGATAAVLATGGTAFAYFTSTGTGTGSASVGSAAWQVAQTTHSGTVYPVPQGTALDSTNSETLTFTVTNGGHSSQRFSTATASVPAEASGQTGAGDAESGGADIQGCDASWFNASVASDPSVNTSIAPGSTATVTVTVSMTDDPTTNQDACQGKTPDVTLNIDPTS